MADAVATQKLFDGERMAIMKFTNMLLSLQMTAAVSVHKVSAAGIFKCLTCTQCKFNDQ